jgi:hypothetical protein
MLADSDYENNCQHTRDGVKVYPRIIWETLTFKNIFSNKIVATYAL